VDIEFQALIDSTLSEQAQQKIFNDAVERIEQTTKQIDEAALGHPVEVQATVIGPLSVELYFLIGDDVIKYIAEQLAMNSPRGSGADKHPGQYIAANTILADGVAVTLDSLPQAKVYMFVNITPYAEKIEHGESSQAPNGVYEVTANSAQRKFPSSQIAFVDYMDTDGKHPAIEVTL
jgi:hypothetical protein